MALLVRLAEVLYDCKVHDVPATGACGTHVVAKVRTLTPHEKKKKKPLLTPPPFRCKALNMEETWQLSENKQTYVETDHIISTLRERASHFIAENWHRPVLEGNDVTLGVLAENNEEEEEEME